MKIKITDDLYDIAWRLRAIDDYDIYYNTTLKRYEIYSSGKLEVVIPYKTLDARTIMLVRKTRVERLEKIMKEIEENNRKLELERQRKLADCIEYKGKSLYKYLENHENKYVDFEEL